MLLMWRNWNAFLWEFKVLTAFLENTLADHWKTNHALTIPSNSIFSYLNQSHEDGDTPKCVYKCSGNRPRLEPIQMSLSEWLNKLWNICTVKFYSAVNRSRFLINAKPWMNLQRKIMSGEKSQFPMLHTVILFT